VVGLDSLAGAVVWSSSGKFYLENYPDLQAAFGTDYRLFGFELG
jgi:hypothetical protein